MSNPDYNATTTGTEVAAALAGQIRGKNVVLTGVSPSSIGSATALAIASQSPATLVLASRTRSKIEEVVSEIEKLYPGVKTKVVVLDLSSIDSIKSAASEITESLDHIDVLINNAGLNLQTRETVTTPGGIKVDGQLYTNHVGPFLFTDLVLSKFVSAGKAIRIVNVSSHGHRLSPIRYSDLTFEKDLYEGVPESERPPTQVNPGFLTLKDGYPGFIGYGQSKAANILHAVELTRRLQKKDKNSFALSVHPGTINTGLMRNLDAEGKDTMGGTAPGGVWKTPDQGCATTIVAAFDPAFSSMIASKPCIYLANCQLADNMLAAHAADVEAAGKLWQQTEAMLGIRSAL